MSDRPEESRPSSEAAGGWFVPKNAMTEQQIVASAAQPTGDVPMPDTAAPQKSGEWYVPPGAEGRAAEFSAPVQADQPAKTPVAEQPGKEQAVKTNLPQGAALSSEVDYSNYVPGKGFVPKEAAAPGTTSAAPAASEPQPTNPQPAIDQPAVDQPQVAGAASPQPAAQAEAVYGTQAQPASQPAGQASAQASRAAQSAQQGQPGQPAPSAQPAQPSGVTGPQSPAGVTGPSQPIEPARPVNPELVQRYADVERSVQVLRRRYSAGSITRDQLQAELRKLMILDEDGYWWMIGLETDRWYKYNGKDWVPAIPPGRTPEVAASAAEASPAPAAESAPSGAGAAPADDQASLPQNRYDIPLDEYGMPLPQRVPITDPGATMVGAAAPRLDNTLRSEPPTRAGGGTPGYFQRVSQQGGVAPYDGGVTVPNQALQMTQPGAAVRSGAAAGGLRTPAVAGPAAPAIPAPQAPAAPRLKPSFQPDYGEKPKSILVDRQRRAGCLIRLAIASVFLVLAGSLLGVVAMVLGYYSIIQQYDAKISSLAQSVRAVPQSVRIMDKNGRVLSQLNDPNTGSRIYVPLNQISPYLVASTIRVENKRFYEDPGFDLVAIARAILQNLRAGEGVSGASSITQQLTRGFVLDPGAAQDRSSRRKITEIIVASEIARRYNKNDILEWYLNTNNYGNLAYGVEAASQTYFQKSAKDLNLAESAFLAGLVQAPATYDPVVHRDAAMQRYADVLGLLPDTGCINMEPLVYSTQPCIDQNIINQFAVQVAQVKAKTFRPSASSAIYPHFVNYVSQQLEAKFGKDALYTSGFNVYTTIDPRVQDAAEAAVKQQIAALAGRNVTNGAVLAIRPSDGAVLAMVGSVDFNNKNIQGEFNVTLAPRQPGSSIKPFVYAAAFERNPQGGYWTPATIIWDVPSCFGGQPGYCPRNYDSRFHGPQSARYALANSYNIPAVKVLQYVTVDRFKQEALRMGLTFPLTQPEQAGLAAALGGVEVPLIDMVRGYSVFANNGKLIDDYAIAKVTHKNSAGQEETVFEQTDHPSSQVLEPGISYLITSILSDNQARLPAFGAGNPLQLRDGRPAAVKTGTTNDSKDNWTIGYTPQLVVGVWVGNNNNSPMVGTSGVTGAAPIWNQIMTQALAGQPPQQFQPPSNVQQARICADFGTQDFQECQTHAVDYFFVPNPPPPAANLFKTMQIDSFSGLIANENCPDYVQNKTFLILDDPTAISWLNNDPNGQNWAKSHNVDLPVVPPPDKACDPNTPRPILKVIQPQPQTTVQGIVEIRGSVSVPNFNRYQFEVGPGLNANQFTIIDGPYTAQPTADNSFLGRWDTTGVPNGPYTLRLFAVDGQGHHAEIRLPLNVNNVAATAQPSAGPIIIPTAQPGQPIQPTQVFQQPVQPQPGQPQPGEQPTATPIVIQSNPPTPTMKPLFPPTAKP